MARHTAVMLGAGPRGRDHALAFADSDDRFELLGWCDRDESRLTEAIEATGVNVPRYRDAKTMLAETRPAVFCFATPLPIRLELIELAIDHGVRAIAYEKPMAGSLAEARRICERCDEAGVRQIICHQHKFGRHWQRVKQIIDSGAIGHVHTFHATSRGWYLLYITHLIDYVMYLNGPEHRGQWMAAHAHGRSMLADAHPSPEYVLGKIGFANGATAVFECGSAAPHLPGENSFWLDAGVKAIGSEGWAHAIVGHGWQAMTRDSAGLLESTEHSFHQTRDTFPHIRALADWLDDGDAVHPNNGDVAYHGFELSMGMLLSALDRRLVRTPVQTDRLILPRLQAELPQSPSLGEE